jgi:hypothetical protein
VIKAEKERQRTAMKAQIFNEADMKGKKEGENVLHKSDLDSCSNPNTKRRRIIICISILSNVKAFQGQRDHAEVQCNASFSTRKFGLMTYAVSKFIRLAKK